MGEKDPGEEVTPESEACPKTPKPKKEKSTHPLQSYLPKWNRTQILAITLTTLTFVSFFSVGRWYLLMMPLQNDNVIWSKTYGGSGAESLASLIQLSDNGFVFCGSTTSWGLGGDWTGTGGGTDMWIVRLDEDANILWNHTYGTISEDRAISVIECEDGGFAFIGTSYVNRSGDYDQDALFIRLDENGNQLWNSTYGGTGWENPTSLVQCTDGGFAFAGGTIKFSANQTDLWLVRTDPAGNIMWNQTYLWVSTQSGAYVIETESGFLLFTEGNWGTMSIDTPNNDAYLLSTDSYGHLLWNRTYDTGGHDYGFKIITETTGGYTLYCNTGPTQSPWYVWVIRINDNGDILGENIIDLYGGMALDIVKCHDDGFAIVGTYTLVQTWFHYNLYLVRTDTQGTVLWQRQYGFEEVADAGHVILQLSDGSLLTAGLTHLGGSHDNSEAWLLRVADTPIAYYTITYFMLVGVIVVIITFTVMCVLIIIQRRWLPT